MPSDFHKRVDRLFIGGSYAGRVIGVEEWMTQIGLGKLDPMLNTIPDSDDNKHICELEKYKLVKLHRSDRSILEVFVLEGVSVIDELISFYTAHAEKEKGHEWSLFF